MKLFLLNAGITLVFCGIKWFISDAPRLVFPQDEIKIWKASDVGVHRLTPARAQSVCQMSLTAASVCKMAINVSDRVKNISIAEQGALLRTV